MGKTWVLDTDTKGTGAQMVPLEKVLEEPVPRYRAAARPKRKARRPEAPKPRERRRFRVTDALSREVLVDDATARATVDALRGVRSIVDVTIHVWEPGPGRWRALTMREKKLLWGPRG